MSDKDRRGVQRNNFFRRKLMTASDFRAEQDYHISRRRLLNRAIFGWGIVFGLRASSKDGKISVSEGLALDQCGRELDLMFEVQLNARNTSGYDLPWAESDRFQLCIHYAEESVDVVYDGHAETGLLDQWNRVRETVLFSIRKYNAGDYPSNGSVDRRPSAAAETSNASLGSDSQSDEGDERTLEGPEYAHAPDRGASGRTADAGGDGSEGPVDTRIPQSILDDWTREPLRPTRQDLGEWQPTARSEPLKYDKGNWVAIAVLKGSRETGGWEVSDQPEAIRVREILKRNELLFDVITGRDLTRIKNVSWAGCIGKEISWDELQELFRPAVRDQAGKLLDGKLQVEFTGEVKESSLRDAVRITVEVVSQNPNYKDILVIPSEFEVVGPNLANITVNGDWWHTTFEDDTPNQKLAFQPLVIIEIFGDQILDMKNVPIDANSYFGNVATTGDGTPGGICRTTFRVGERPPRAGNQAEDPLPAAPRPLQRSRSGRTAGE